MGFNILGYKLNNIITAVLINIVITALVFSHKIRWKNKFYYSFHLYYTLFINLIYNIILDSFSNNVEIILWLLISILLITVLAIFSKNYSIK